GGAGRPTGSGGSPWSRRAPPCEASPMARRPNKPKADRAAERTAATDPGGRPTPGESPPGPTPEAGRKPWLPPPESVVSESEFVSPSGRRYKAVRTTERAAYDEAGRPPQPKARKNP